MPAPAMKPIMEVAVKKAPSSQWAGKDSDQRKGNGHHDDQGCGKGLKPAHHQNKDQHQHHAEGNAQIPEDLVGDVPFAVPFHGEAPVAVRHVSRVLFDLVAFRKGNRFDLFAHFQNGIDRAFLCAGHIAGDIHHRHQVFMVNAAIKIGLFGPDQLGKRYQTAVGGRQFDRIETLDSRP